MRKLGPRLLLCLSLSGGSLSYSAIGHSAPARASDEDASVAIARERFKEGVAFFDKKEFEKARLAFLQAYALKKHPAVLINLAQSELRSAHEVDAAKHFSEYLREADGNAPEVQAAESGLGAAKAAVLEVEVTVDEAAADVYVDRTFEGTSPLPGAVYVAPGSHVVEARKAGQSMAVQVSGAAGKQVAANVTLTPRPAPPDTTPAPVPGPPPEPEPSSAPLSESSGRKPFFQWLVTTPVGLIGLGLTGAGVGTGIGFAVGSHNAYSNADSIANQIKRAAATDSAPSEPMSASLCTDPAAFLAAADYDEGRTPSPTARANQYRNACHSYADTLDKGDKYKTIATVGFVVGGVAAVGTVLLYFVDSSPKASAAGRAPRRRLAIVPSVAPSLTGLALSGEF